jgi:hypothetical protein
MAEMSMTPLLSNPKFWEMKAEEARVIAESMNDQEARDTMLLIARSYDGIARRAAILAKLEIPKNGPKSGQ